MTCTWRYRREEEGARLREFADRPGPNMALLYGRRRVGKTWLLTNLWDDGRAFYFTASAVTPEQNRRRLVSEVAAWTGDTLHAEDYPTWRTVFRLLLALKPERPIVLILDEFQYFGANDEDLHAVTSELNAAWEGMRSSDRPLLLVLSGSATRTLSALDSGSAPLYGRLSWKARLEPFDYWNAAKMAPFEELRDRARVWGIFGGVPRYLAPIDPSRALGRNVADLVLSPHGEVRLQVETAIHQEQGLRETTQYLGILDAIGAGRTELSEIAGRAGLDHDTGFRTKVERLVDLGYATKGRRFAATTTSPWRYRLADPAFTFHHTFVSRLETALEVHPPLQVWKASVRPHLDTYMGHLFERIVEQAYYRLAAEHNLPLVQEWGRWEGTDRSRRSLEMDLVTRLTSGGMLTGSIKWTRRPVGVGVHRDHLRDLTRLADSGHRWAHEALEGDSILLYASAGGFRDDFRERA
ncbi:MAG: ATP-binding protein [Longimicrobiales bacterium]|nr:ATP-binding protein [Longimicrobiales bacterium]